MQRAARHATVSAFTLLVASAATMSALWTVRPDLTIRSAIAHGDDLAYLVAWLVASAITAWLTLTTLACLVALVHGRPNLAARVARCGPPLVRRVMQTALAGTFVLLPATANATPAAPSAPLVLHVGPGGRVTGVPGADPGIDAPVVRTPPSTTPPPRPSSTTSSTTMSTSTTTSVPDAMPSPLPASAPVVRTPSASPTEPRRESSRVLHGSVARRHLVRGGDNLWQIARSEIARVSGIARPDDRTVARYWAQVVAANRTTLRSGNPSLIYPGELVLLPAAVRP